MDTDSKAILGGRHVLMGSTMTAAEKESGDSPTVTESHAIESIFEIPSSTDFIGPAVDRVVKKIRRARCIPGKESDIEGALFEALANAVIHGNHKDPRKPVHIRCRFEPEKCLSIIVSDEGPGFDPAALPDPTRPENLASDHGRGVFLMRTFMDEVHFEKGGSEVHLMKKCDGAVETLVRAYAARMSDFIHSRKRRKRASGSR